MHLETFWASFGQVSGWGNGRARARGSGSAKVRVGVGAPLRAVGGVGRSGCTVGMLAYWVWLGSSNRRSVLGRVQAKPASPVRASECTQRGHGLRSLRGDGPSPEGVTTRSRS
jgi:hypothetical protein